MHATAAQVYRVEDSNAKTQEREKGINRRASRGVHAWRKTCCDVRWPIDCDKAKIDLAGVGMADARGEKKRQGETPGHGVEEQRAHNERWAGASRLMGRFIISHYQLIPSDRPGPAGAASGVCKRERGRPREDGSQPDEEKRDVKGHGRWRELEQRGEMGKKKKEKIGRE